MSVHRKDPRWIVRWRENGRQRSRAFNTKREAEAFDRLSRADANERTAETYRQLAERLEHQYPGTRWTVEIIDEAETVTS